jgi:hypothetical protein
MRNIFLVAIVVATILVASAQAQNLNFENLSEESIISLLQISARIENEKGSEMVDKIFERFYQEPFNNQIPETLVQILTKKDSLYLAKPGEKPLDYSSYMAHVINVTAQEYVKNPVSFGHTLNATENPVSFSSNSHSVKDSLRAFLLDSLAKVDSLVRADSIAEEIEKKKIIERYLAEKNDSTIKARADSIAQKIEEKKIVEKYLQEQKDSVKKALEDARQDSLERAKIAAFVTDSMLAEFEETEAKFIGIIDSLTNGKRNDPPDSNPLPKDPTTEQNLIDPPRDKEEKNAVLGFFFQDTLHIIGGATVIILVIVLIIVAIHRKRQHRIIQERPGRT